MPLDIKNFLINKNIFFEKNIYFVKGSDDETAKKVSSFYEKIPFPSYKINDNRLSIIDAGNNNVFYRNLKHYIGLNKKILEIGCGTSQLSMYLAIGTNNNIAALDLTKKSLEIGRDFAENNKINNITFVNADLLDRVLIPEVFDYVLSIGVLHHLKSTYQGFLNSIEPLKKGGYVCVGLYNKYGRKRLEFRRFLFKIFGKKIIYFLDPIVRKLKKNENDNKDKIDAWINDQYFHPVENSYSIDTVLNWFKKNNIEFISSIPTMDFEKNSGEKIFLKENLCGKLFRIIIQLLMNFQVYSKEGGVFIIIGKKC